MTNLQSIRDDLIHAQAKIAGGRINLAECYLKRVLSACDSEGLPKTLVTMMLTAVQTGDAKEIVGNLGFLISWLPSQERHEQTKAGERHEH